MRGQGGDERLSDQHVARQARIADRWPDESDIEPFFDQILIAAGRRDTGSRLATRRPHRATIYRLTEYFVNAPPAWAIEFGPSAA